MTGALQCEQTDVAGTLRWSCDRRLLRRVGECRLFGSGIENYSFRGRFAAEATRTDFPAVLGALFKLQVSQTGPTGVNLGVSAGARTSIKILTAM